ncbi:MAG: ABC transporter permease [Methylobacteriaceae bacterium]|nr:ABC transporter permease [Methylobacteriaceae bacterium]
MNELLAWIRAHPGLLERTASEHLTLAGTALAADIAIGLALGIAVAGRPRAAGPVVGIVNALRTVPSIALLVLMLPVLGTGFAPSVVALALYGLPAILVNTTVGLEGVDPEIVEAARGQGLAERQVLWLVVLPLALPLILAGIRTSAVQIVSAATLAVFIGGGGLGELISAGLGLLDFPQLLIGAIAVALLALVTELAFALLQRLATGGKAAAA